MSQSEQRSRGERPDSSEPNAEDEAEAAAAARARAAYRANRRRDNWWALFFIGPQLFGLLAFVAGPLVFALFLSLTTWDGFGERDFVGLDNFVSLLQDETFWVSLRNTAYFTVLVVPGDLACALLIALALNKVRGRIAYRVFFFMPVVTSSVAVSVVWMWLLNGEFGPLNSYLRSWFGFNPPNWLVDPDAVIPALVIVSLWRGVGFTMVIFLAGLQGIPETYIEAAQIDGASPVRRFWHITLPLLSPTILFLTVVSFIGSFQIFDIAFVMTRGGPGDASRTLVYHIYDLAFVKFEFGKSAAVAVILFAILLVLTLLQLRAQRRWVHYED